jgi:hypothetical protein
MSCGLIAVYLNLINAISHCGMAAAMQVQSRFGHRILLFIPLGITTLWVLAGASEIAPTEPCHRFWGSAPGSRSDHIADRYSETATFPAG